jgi:hypothetical protein
MQAVENKCLWRGRVFCHVDAAVNVRALGGLCMQGIDDLWFPGSLIDESPGYGRVIRQPEDISAHGHHDGQSACPTRPCNGPSGSDGFASTHVTAQVQLQRLLSQLRSKVPIANGPLIRLSQRIRHSQSRFCRTKRIYMRMSVCKT